MISLNKKSPKGTTNLAPFLKTIRLISSNFRPNFHIFIFVSLNVFRAEVCVHLQFHDLTVAPPLTAYVMKSQRHHNKRKVNFWPLMVLKKSSGFPLFWFLHEFTS